MIRLVLVDVDGCLTDGEGQPLDLEALSEVAEINQRAQTDPLPPAVTLCTGRPAPYVELLHQAIAGQLPAICENGCGLFVPRPYGFRRHAAIDEQLTAEFSFSIARVRERVVEPGRAFFQPGKEHSATLYPFDMSVHDLYVATCELVGERITLDEGRLCINLMPAGIDKAAGARWLAQETGIPLESMAGIGDADGPELPHGGWPGRCPTQLLARRSPASEPGFRSAGSARRGRPASPDGVKQSKRGAQSALA